MHSNLLLVSKLVSRGSEVHFNTVGCVVMTCNGIVVAISLIGAILNEMEVRFGNGVKWACWHIHLARVSIYVFGTSQWFTSMQ